jgi:hypothetical protein
MFTAQAKNVLAGIFFSRYRPGMMKPADILDSLGRERVAAAIGVDMRRVQRAANEDRLPALWYAALCDLAGHDLPREVFTFKYADRGAA